MLRPRARFVSSFTLLLRCLLLLLLLHSKPSKRQKHLGYAIIITIQQHMYRANRWAVRLLCCIMVLCCRVCISIPMNGRVAGVLCSGALPLSDKTMTQYDEKQRWLSAIVFTKKKDDTLVNTHALSICVRAWLSVTTRTLEGLPSEQMALSNTSV